MLGQQNGMLGWATGKLVAYDEAAPGVIRRLLTAGPMFRQAVFVAVALELSSERHDQVVGHEDHEEFAAKAEVLRSGRAKEVIAQATGTKAPEGLLGTLERIGLTPLRSRNSYLLLMDMFMKPAMEQRAKVLAALSHVDAGKICCAHALPTSLLHPEIVKRLDGITDTYDFVEAVQFAKSVNSRVTDRMVVESAALLRDDTKLPVLIERMVRRADKPLGAPLPADEDVSPILTPREMIYAGRELHNCMATQQRLTGALLGRAAYARFRGDMIMEFVALSNGTWLYTGCHGRRNLPLTDEVTEAAEAKCRAAGVGFLCRGVSRGGRFADVTDSYAPRLLDFAA